MPEKKGFLKQFWKEKKMVGAMAPSSRFLAKKMLNNIDFSTDKVLVELGPGTGVFTKEIIKKMAPDATLLVFELNDTFFNALKNKINDSRVILIHDSAEKIQHYLNENQFEVADSIISSLPLSNFPKQLRDTILVASKNALKENGKYIQFQYSLQIKRHIQRVFPSIDLQFTPLNFPPAFVLTCKK
ncbi:MAG: methyltransferase [Crocinitomicaceae bacterium]|nr:methyltransferase [Crocinitomicaceae bacterium]